MTYRSRTTHVQLRDDSLSSHVQLILGRGKGRGKGSGRGRNTTQVGIASHVSKPTAALLEAPTIANPKTPTDAMPDVLEDLLESSPECQVPECSSAAAWVLTMRCCRLTAVFCDSHHDAQVRGSFGETHDGTCSGCSRTWMPIARAIEWRPL